MFCKYCGKEHADDALYCSNCGEAVNAKKVEEKKPARCWSIFARVGKALGIVTLATCWIPIFGLYSLIPGMIGITFGVLGKFAREEPYTSSARTGFITSLIGTILSFVLFFAFIFLMIVLSEM